MSNDYISRDAVLDDLRTIFDTEAWDCTDGGHLIRYEDAECALKEITAADVVPVVRCKDCKHAKRNLNHPDKPLICCLTRQVGETDEDWFCADGERKERKCRND